MASSLLKLGRSCARHPLRVVAVWLIIATVAVTLKVTVGGDNNDNYRVPGTEAQHANDRLAQRFPQVGGVLGRIAVHDNQDRLDSPRLSAGLRETVANLGHGHNVSMAVSPLLPVAHSLSPDKHTGYIDVQYTITHLTKSNYDEAKQAVSPARQAGIDVEFTGSIANAGKKPGGDLAVGLVIAIIVLLIAFGSVLAVGIPIGTALMSTVIGLSALGLIAAHKDVPDTAPVLATMIGVAVGIDYALFVFTRHRQQLREGYAPVDAAAIANATAGKAVVFAGLTVVIAILGLGTVGLPTVSMLGLSTAIVVVVSIAAAITMLPAILGRVGTKASPSSKWRDAQDNPTAATVVGRWAHRVAQRPRRFALLGFAVLLVLAIPLFSMHLGIADDSNDATSSTQHRAYELLAQNFGKGFTAPMAVVVELRSSGDKAAVVAAYKAVGHDPGVAAISPPLVNRSGDTAVMAFEAKTLPQDSATNSLVKHLRREVLPGVLKGTHATVLLGGDAVLTDLSDRIDQRLPYLIGLVVLLSFLLLVVGLRSIVAPLKAVLINLLPIGAAYGVLVAVFEWGWCKSLLGVSATVPVNPFVPMALFAIMFGLSMEHEVFLLSRIREAFNRTGDSKQSVVVGLTSTSRAITSAAIIMISVFAGFVFSNDVTIKMFGVGLATAVLLDAIVVRLVLVPATLSLRGSANWWVPRWLDRALPHVDVEPVTPTDAEESAHNERPGNLVPA